VNGVGYLLLRNVKQQVVLYHLTCYCPYPYPLPLSPSLSLSLFQNDETQCLYSEERNFCLFAL
jgi:hypothetical protein